MKQYFAINHHDNISKGSQRFAHHLINYHYNKLLVKSGNPKINEIIQYYQPFVNTWNNSFIFWRSAFNTEMGSTTALNNCIDALTHVKAPKWVINVYNIYPEGSEKAKVIFPHKRKALITGTVLERITAIKTFIKLIENDVNLSTTCTDAKDFLLLFEPIFQNHEKAKGKLTELSKNQEILRISTTTAMLTNEGSLITIYSATPNMVDLFFDVSAMRQRQSKKKNKSGSVIQLMPSELKLIDIRFIGNEIWKVTNKGEKDACLFFAASNDILTIPPEQFVIHPGDSMQIDLSTISADQRFAYVANLSNEDSGMLNILQIV